MEFPLPDRDYPPLREFWAGVASRELRFPRCADCRNFVWYPQPICPHCHGVLFHWTRVGGPARVFAWTLVRRALHAPFKPIVPYVPVIVTFEDAPGVRLVSRWINPVRETPEIGEAVTIVFEDFGAPKLATGRVAPLVQ
jgi:uncharacterized OB-fold protein